MHERIAEALGWSVADTRSFSLATLRELVRPINAKLAELIGQEIASGYVVVRKGR